MIEHDLSELIVLRGRYAHPIGSCCDTCEIVAFPPLPRCSECGSPTSRLELSGKGVVRASTVVHSPPRGFAAPFTLGVVDLEEGPRLIAPLDGAKSGDPVRAAPATLSNGAKACAFKLVR